MVTNGLAHKASQAAINGFALWADPVWDNPPSLGSNPSTPPQPSATSSDARAAQPSLIRTSIPIRIAAVAGLLLLFPVLWRTLGSLRLNALTLHPHPKHPHPNA